MGIVDGLFGLFGAGVARRADARRYDQARTDDLADYSMQLRDSYAAYDRQRTDGLDDQANQFVRLRDAAEKGGYNPLAVLGTGVAAPQPGIGLPSMGALSAASMGNAIPSDGFGAAIGEAGLKIADGVAKFLNPQTSAALEFTRQRNTELSDELQHSTLRPRVLPPSSRESLPVVYETRPYDQSPAERMSRNPVIDYQSYGQSTGVGQGPDVDEAVTGWMIDANNRMKAVDKGRRDSIWDFGPDQSSEFRESSRARSAREWREVFTKPFAMSPKHFRFSAQRPVESIPDDFRESAQDREYRRYSPDF